MSSLTTDFNAMTATTNFALRKPHELPDTYGKGRVCKHVITEGKHAGEQCQTIVSIYNPWKWCWLHTKHHRAEMARSPLGRFYCGECGQPPRDECDTLACPFHA